MNLICMADGTEESKLAAELYQVSIATTVLGAKLLKKWRVPTNHAEF
jgi:hypothetical protein